MRTTTRLTGFWWPLLLAWLGFGGLVFSQGAAAAEPGKPSLVTAVGQAAVVGTDQAAARDRAIDDALRRAVEQTVGTLISSETVTQNFQLISDKILSKSRGYVRTYQITAEGRKDGNVYEVTVAAEVGQGNLKNDLDGILAILKAKNMPRVLLMISEQHVGAKSAEAWWGDKTFKTTMDIVENVFIESWLPKGVKFVDRQALVGKLSTGLTNSAAPDERVVKEYASKEGAEVVIRGDASAKDNGAMLGTNMHSIQATVSVRAMNLDTGEVLGTAMVNQTVGHIDPLAGGSQALKKAGQKAADELLGKLLAQWETQVANTTNLVLVVNNIKKSRDLKSFADVVKSEVRGVTDIRQRSFKKKAAELEVDFKGSAQDLAAELEDKQYPGFSLEIEEVTANTVKVSMK